MSQRLLSLMFPGFTFFPLDPEVGNVQRAGAEAVAERLRGKRTLVVGGTSGIGRGIALAMARAGSSVSVVGHSSAKGTAAVERMSAVAPFPTEQRFQAHAADLLTVRGCMALAAELKEGAARFDYAVFTVGIWPDKEDPRTADGVDKVLALDVLARFVITREVMPLLNSDARIMSVLASTARIPPAPAIATMKRLMTGEQTRYMTPQMLGTAGVAGDSWLQAAAARSPGVTFIGTFPGIVATDLVKTSKTFPSCLRPVLAAGQRLVALSPEECGELHAQILASPNASRRPVTYFNAMRLEGRLANPVAYDKEFQEWVWSFLEEAVARRT